MSGLEVIMMRRVGELNKEVAALNQTIKQMAADSIKDMGLVAELESENARLKAEVERLTALVESNLNSSKIAMGKADAVLRERDTLIGEVERLRKAGDALAICLCGRTTEHHNKRCALEWIAAKEGKPAE